ncbi:adenylyl-sulfate kinase [Nanoarchaeota archaeon]|nr:MAG: adenylyl-sulfate kinase [Nanoarchaeota archaeon]
MKSLDKGFVVWFTVLPGSGKTTIAEALRKKLQNAGYRVELLDGDWVRRTINPDAGFTKEERRIQLLRVAWIARLLARNGVITLCSFVSPYRDVRSEIRKIIEEELPFIEVYTKCSLEECIKRDPKGLYKRALAGEIKNFTGIDDPYEEPENPELIIDAEHNSAEQNAEKVLEKLKEALLINISSSR